MSKSLSFGLSQIDDPFAYPLVKEKKQLIPYDFAKEKGILPLKEEGGKLLVAIIDPLDYAGIEEVRLQTGKEIVEVLCEKGLLEAAIEQVYHQSEKETTELFDSFQKEGTLSSLQEEEYDLLRQSHTVSPVVRMLNAILLEAIQQGASDIHFEPHEAQLVCRYRIDGVLQLRHRPHKEYQAQLLARIKVMAHLDIAEQRLPQDGRIKLRMGSRQIDFRVSTIPVAYGERVVLRILDRSNVLARLDKIGMSPQVLKTFSRLIRMSEGIVLVTGPTGSGKTTTLYSGLSAISSDETNIMTIEDPVEYKLQGMAQIGVNPRIGLTFARGLRHILRQDPDVIMIGEVRDQETAEIAIQAALTGHLVLSTLHTNDAPSALTRLIDMGIEPYLLSSSVIGVLAQRLVRMICPHCKEAYTPAPSELTGLGLPKGTELYRGAGCNECFGTGYKGRRGVYELMSMSGAIRRRLVETGDSTLLRSIALEEGMESLRLSGGTLAGQGITTTEEVFRVTRGCEE